MEHEASEQTDRAEHGRGKPDRACTLCCAQALSRLPTVPEASTNAAPNPTGPHHRAHGQRTDADVGQHEHRLRRVSAVTVRHHSPCSTRPASEAPAENWGRRLHGAPSPQRRSYQQERGERTAQVLHGASRAADRKRCIAYLGLGCAPGPRCRPHAAPMRAAAQSAAWPP